MSGLQMWPVDRLKQETGLCRADVYRRMSDTDPRRNPFPRNHSCRAGRARFWRSDEVNAWKLRECGASELAGPVDLYELGLALASGAAGVAVDLIEAHKWFNLAALNGSEAARECRAAIAEEMSARDIAEAQRRARAWLAESEPARQRN